MLLQSFNARRSTSRFLGVRITCFRAAGLTSARVRDWFRQKFYLVALLRPACVYLTCLDVAWFWYPHKASGISRFCVVKFYVFVVLCSTVLLLSLLFYHILISHTIARERSQRKVTAIAPEDRERPKSPLTVQNSTCLPNDVLRPKGRRKSISRRPQNPVHKL